jgi:transposase-like protein
MAKEKDLIQKFSEDKKVVSKVNNYLGSAYLLMSMAMHDVDVACEELKKYGLEFRDLKYRHNRVEFEFDKLHRCYRSMIKGIAEQRQFNEDCLQYMGEIHKLFGLEDE